MARNRIESYNSRSRLKKEKKQLEKKLLELKKIELDSFKELVIEQYIEENRGSSIKRLLNIFKI
jgi:hypothetical protein